MHSEWRKWLEEKVEFSNITATRFIKVANECSNLSASNYKEGNCD
ncbi:DUF3102 domain-containing protein [Acetobacterium bakii]